jgi:uncharacterized protein YutE (UPF0331/DUF86 family)
VLSFQERLKTASAQLRSAVARARDLSGAEARQAAGPASSARLEALAFNLERAAWASLEIAQAWVFELRLGIPRKETESFDLLQRHGWVELDRARRYKQLCEFRSLSQREPERTDWQYLGGDLAAELSLFDEWERQARDWVARAPEREQA